MCSFIVSRKGGDQHLWIVQYGPTKFWYICSFFWFPGREEVNTYGQPSMDQPPIGSQPLGSYCQKSSASSLALQEERHGYLFSELEIQIFVPRSTADRLVLLSLLKPEILVLPGREETQSAIGQPSIDIPTFVMYVCVLDSDGDSLQMLLTATSIVLQMFAHCGFYGPSGHVQERDMSVPGRED